MEILFLLSFTLHNIEEGLWLPRWSQHAGKYHPPVCNREFHFALLVITVVGYLITFGFLVFGQSSEIPHYIFVGFVLMMSMNGVFPHLVATIVLRRYAPGTLTGLILNVPIGSVIIAQSLETGLQLQTVIIYSLVITFLTIASLRPLFRLGNELIDEY